MHQVIALKRGLCAVGLVAVCASPGVAQDSGGVQDPLAAGVGARERALGTGQVTASGVTALGWNPALLTRADRWLVHAHVAPLPEGGDFEHVGVARPLGRGALGAALSRLGSGGIRAYDSAGVPRGEFDFADSELSLGYAAPVGGGLTAGAAWRYRWQALGDSKSGGSGVDLGVAYARSARAAFTFAGQLRGALSPRLDHGGGADPLPRSFDLAVAYARALGGRRLELSAASSSGRTTTIAVGAEYALGRALSARLAYADGKPRAGLGLAIPGFGFDYVLESHDYALVHGVSVTAGFGRGVDRRVAEAEGRGRRLAAAAATEARQAELDALKANALEASQAGDSRQAARLWNAYLHYRPDDPEGTAALAQLDARASQAQADSVAAARQSTVQATRLQAVRQALERRDLEAAGVLIEQLAATPGVPSSELDQLRAAWQEATAARLAELRAQAQALERRRQWVEAAAGWSAVLVRAPNDALAQAGLERVRAELAKLRERSAQQAVELSRMTLLTRALDAYGAEEFVLAEALVDSLLAVQPSSEHGRELKRRLARRTAPPDAVVREEERRLYIDGMRHFNAGRYTEAIQAWEKILEFDPDNDSVRRNIDEARARSAIERRTD